MGLLIIRPRGGKFEVVQPCNEKYRLRKPKPPPTYILVYAPAMKHLEEFFFATAETENRTLFSFTRHTIIQQPVGMFTTSDLKRSWL